MSILKKSPQQRIRTEDKKIYKARDKKSKLDPKIDDDKIWKLNKQIHRSKVEIEIAKAELKSQKTTTTNVSFNKNDNSKNVNIHGHYHAASKTKKK